jgi:hypothetical protein
MSCFACAAVGWDRMCREVRTANVKHVALIIHLTLVRCAVDGCITDLRKRLTAGAPSRFAQLLVFQ